MPAAILEIFLAVSIAFAFRVEAQDQDPVFFLQIVDRGNTGFSPGIDVSRDGMPHIGYLDHARGMVRYAHWTESGWGIEDVSDWSGGDRQRCAFKLSADGAPFFAFKRRWYSADAAQREGSGWRIDEISVCNGGVHALALSAAPDGSMHICDTYTCSGGIYYDGVDYAVWQGSAWTVSPVNGVPAAFAFLDGTCSIAATSEFDPHIALWADYSGIGYLRIVGGRWFREVVSPGSLGTWSSIALDAARVPHIAFYESGALKLGVRGPQGWTVEVVDEDGDVGQSCSLAIGADGASHIAYYDATRGDLKYARRASAFAKWTIHVVASSGNVGRDLSLALDMQGDVHIAFHDATQGALGYATTSRRVAVQSATWGGVRAKYR